MKVVANFEPHTQRTSLDIGGPLGYANHMILVTHVAASPGRCYAHGRLPKTWPNHMVIQVE